MPGCEVVEFKLEREAEGGLSRSTLGDFVMRRVGDHLGGSTLVLGHRRVLSSGFCVA